MSIQNVSYLVGYHPVSTMIPTDNPYFWLDTWWLPTGNHLLRQNNGWLLTGTNRILDGFRPITTSCSGIPDGYWPLPPPPSVYKLVTTSGKKPVSYQSVTTSTGRIPTGYQLVTVKPSDFLDFPTGQLKENHKNSIESRKPKKKQKWREEKQIRTTQEYFNKISSKNKIKQQNNHNNLKNDSQRGERLEIMRTASIP